MTKTRMLSLAIGQFFELCCSFEYWSNCPVKPLKMTNITHSLNLAFWQLSQGLVLPSRLPLRLVDGDGSHCKLQERIDADGGVGEQIVFRLDGN